MEMIPAGGGAGDAQTEANDKALVERMGSALTGTAAGQAAIMDGSAGNLVNAAGQSFKLQPEAAATLIAAYRLGIEIIDQMEPSIRRVCKASNLGTLPAAQTVAEFTASVGSNPSRGYRDSMLSLRATLVQMAEACQKATTNYEETNAQIADTMNKLSPGSVSSGSMPSKPASNGESTF